MFFLTCSVSPIAVSGFYYSFFVVSLPSLGFALKAAREFASKIPVAEGGPAGSEVPGATISAAPERLGGAVLGDI
jgi:hypothetical protein